MEPREGGEGSVRERGDGFCVEGGGAASRGEAGGGEEGELKTHDDA